LRYRHSSVPYDDILPAENALVACDSQRGPQREAGVQQACNRLAHPDCTVVEHVRQRHDTADCPGFDQVHALLVGATGVQEERVDAGIPDCRNVEFAVGTLEPLLVGVPDVVQKAPVAA